jgi:anti-sigma regulatory factor (Ser/Thr protein kinase)
MRGQILIPVTDPSVVGEGRRRAARLAEEAGLDATDQGRVAIVVTELATNLVRHARDGRLILRSTAAGGSDGAVASVEVLAVDAGPGMADVNRCLSDGFSTGGTAGNGLGAVRRMSDEFDIYSAASGTVVLARVNAGRVTRGVAAAARSPRWGGVSVPAPGEEVCGDAWRVVQAEGLVSIIVADGLGHGPIAAEAADGACGVFAADPFREPKAIVEAAHRAISGTRGAAVAVARFDAVAGQLRYAAVGNIAGSLLHGGASRGLVTHNGTVGHQVRVVQQFEYPWRGGSVVVMHSDGLQSRWSMDKYPGLLARHPAVIAGVLLRDFRRGRDDVTVVVASLPQ